MEVTMKPILPLCICTLALSGCFTVKVSDEATEQTEQSNTENQIPENNNDDNTDGNSNSDGETPSTADVPVNRFPTISGSAINEIEIEQPYSFTPSATDEDGDTLTFEIQNKPIWANFNGITGELSGTPKNVETYSNIIITVTDGEYSASLNAFDISVLEPPISKVTLSWQPPTEDVDGNDVDSISAYKIFYGNTQGNPDKHITVNDGSVKKLTISNLEPGEYYFTMSAVSSNGMESDASNEHYFKIEELN